TSFLGTVRLRPSPSSSPNRSCPDGASERKGGSDSSGCGDECIGRLPDASGDRAGCAGSTSQRQQNGNGSEVGACAGRQSTAAWSRRLEGRRRAGGREDTARPGRSGLGGVSRGAWRGARPGGT